MDMDSQVGVTWRNAMTILGIVALLSAGGGSVAGGLVRGGVTADDLEQLEQRRETRVEQRLQNERDRISASYADDRDVARITAQLTALEQRVGELTTEVRGLRAELSDRPVPVARR